MKQREQIGSTIKDLKSQLKQAEDALRELFALGGAR